MSRMHPHDLRAVMAAILSTDAKSYTGEGWIPKLVEHTDHLIAELERTAVGDKASPTDHSVDTNEMVCTNCNDLLDPNEENWCAACHIGYTELKAKLEAAEARNQELELGIAAIGDMAVCGWDGATTGKADALVPDGKKYADSLRELFTSSARSTKLAEALEVAKEAMDERRGYASGWDWKYGEAWDEEDAQVKAALAAYREGKP